MANSRKAPKYAPITVQILGPQLKFPLSVHSIDPISSIKRQIYVKKGIPVGKQHLFRQGIELENSLNLVDYLILDRETLLLRLDGPVLPPPPKLFFGHLIGTTIRTEAIPGDTVLKVKEKVRFQKKVNTKLQRIFFKGRELEDHWTLAECGVRPEATLTVILPNSVHQKSLYAGALELQELCPAQSNAEMERNMQISVISSTGITVLLSIGSQMRIEQVKEEIRKETGLPVDQQQLLFRNQALSDSALVRDCAIEQDSKLHLLVLGAGGFQLFLTFSCFANLSRVPLHHSGPKSERDIEPGLSFNSHCQNPQCTVFGNDIIVNLGFGRFDIAKAADLLKCPICDTVAEKGNSCGFKDAEWHIQGVEGDTAVEKWGQTESSDYYYTYKGDGTTNWRCLTITVTPCRHN